MNGGEQKTSRLTLTLLFSMFIFLVILLTMLVVGPVFMRLVLMGALPRVSDGFVGIRYLIFLIMLASVVLGTIISYFVVKIPLYPLNQLINGMNRLAGGDYKTRIHVGEPLESLSVGKELTDSFNTLAEELEGTELLRADFINNFSHEFKTPIVSVAGFAGLLRRGNLTEEQRDEYLAIIESESRRLSNMATNVLNLTRVENQSILTGIESYNLSEQLRTCILQLEDKWAAKNLEPDPDFGEHSIEANRELLKQVWLNLLDNAVKFATEGSVIGLKVTETEDNLLVSVANEGPEIPAEAREKIFRKFYQADESHAAEGNGIGLAVVRRVVELHRGSVAVQSAGDAKRSGASPLEGDAKRSGVVSEANGRAVLNDMPVACQTRAVTEPQREAISQLLQTIAFVFFPRRS